MSQPMGDELKPVEKMRIRVAAEGYQGYRTLADEQSDSDTDSPFQTAPPLTSKSSTPNASNGSTSAPPGNELGRVKRGLI